MRQVKIRSYTVPWSGTTNILFWFEEAGKTWVAKPILLDFTEAHPACEVEPSLSVSEETAREFKKALLDIHFSEPAIEGELKATKAHLEDMRKLAKVK